MAVNVSFRQVGRKRSGRIYIGPNSDTYSHVTAPSIPSKDDLVLERPSDASNGFGSSQPRFSLIKQTTPAPGQYSSLPASQAVSPSFSKKGYGGFVSKKKRFDLKAFVSAVPGPGSYVSISRQVDSHPSSIFVLPKFQSRTAKLQLPAPGQYNPFTPKQPSGPSAIFKSKTKRPDNACVVQGPAPWYYTPDETLIRSSSQKLTSTFKKPENNRRFKLNLYDPHAPVLDEAVPGPGYYTENSQKQEVLSGSLSRSEIDRFGGSLKPRNSKESSPGPGSYDALPPVRREKLLVSGAVFMSESQRDFVKATKVPGPAFYTLPTGANKKSFHLNSEQRWV